MASPVGEGWSFRFDDPEEHWNKTETGLTMIGQLVGLQTKLSSLINMTIFFLRH